MKNRIDYSKLNEYLIKHGFKFNGAISAKGECAYIIDYIHPKSDDVVKKTLRVFVPVIDFESRKYDFRNVQRIEGHVCYSDGSKLSKVIVPDFNNPSWQRLMSE